ncbi:MAG: lipopolysaccharide biosynthesis protein [Proteobacteria bacterium]|nr:lipopolysaccharide biosynthesis protein [Pseudomonadota bacterium]
MTHNLKHVVAHGFFWSLCERIGQQGIQFVIYIILARLLVPEQYGQIAMLSIFMAVAQCFIDSGFGSALIQKQDVNHLDECTVFYFNIIVSFLVVGLLWLAAPWIASFYNMPNLLVLTRVLALNLIINSFGVVQGAILTKHINFKPQMKFNLVATVVSGSIGVIMAYMGYGVWSLVAQSIAVNLVRTALLWLFVNWRPALLFSFNSLRTMFPFGSRLLFSALLDRIYNNLFSIIIGKMFSAADLGFYSRANQMQQLPVDNISASVSRVAYPVFSSIQGDKPRLKVGVHKSLTILAMVNFPLMIGLATVARPLVLVLLTEKWLPCVPYLQLLCMVGLLYPLHAINLSVLVAQGRSDLFFRLEILKKMLGVALIVLTFHWGISVMISGQIVGSIICYFLNSYYTGKFLDYPIVEQLRDLLHSLILSVLMAGGIHVITFLSISQQPFLLIAQIVTGIVLYVVLCRLTKLPSFMESLEMIKPKLTQICCIH